MVPARECMMKPKMRIKADEIIQNIRSGMTDEELIAKYHVNSNVLRGIFEKLVDAGLLIRAELSGRASLATDSAIREQPRTRTRHYTMFALPVYDLDDLTVEGYLLDITENGLKVSGLEVKKGQTKSLLVRVDEFADIFPFTLDARCRWVDRESDEHSVIAGFEITNISDVGLAELRNLSRMLALGE